MRGLAYNFMNWLISQFDIVSTKERPDEMSMSELLAEYLDDQAYGILNYKRKAEAQGIDGIINCKAADVERQLDLLFNKTDGFPHHMADGEKDLSGYNTFTLRDYTWRVVRKTSAGIFTGE
jgi:hypothetical protein